jgi:sugar phosphate isomerase/epimerase
MNPLSRLSLNLKTVERWSLPEALEGCARAQIPWVGLWREKVAEYGLQKSIRHMGALGLKVSSLCRGGFFPSSSRAAFKAALDDNRRAIEEAATLGAGVLALVCGAAPDRDIQRARDTIAEGIGELVPFALEHKVVLGIEPLNPMFAADRSAIVTLQQAHNLAQQHPKGTVGIVVDAYHVWWDPQLEEQVAGAGERIVGFHISDWIVPIPDPLLGRGMMGDGVIELRRLREMVDSAGYSGPIEVEIFNQGIWDMPGDEVLGQIKQRFLSEVLAG